MKPWAARTKRDKATRIVASLAIGGILAYGTPRFVTDIYDYAVAASCRDEIIAAVEEYKAAPSAPQGGSFSDTARYILPTERRLMERIQAARCPTSVADEQAAFVAAMTERIELVEGVSQGASFNMTAFMIAQDELMAAYRDLYEALGVPLP